MTPGSFKKSNTNSISYTQQLIENTYLLWIQHTPNCLTRKGKRIGTSVAPNSASFGNMEDISFLNQDQCTYEKCWIRNYIISYLANYPDSADTEDGVQWWLWDQWIKKMGPKIQTVINDLVDEGLILKKKLRILKYTTGSIAINMKR